MENITITTALTPDLGSYNRIAKIQNKILCSDDSEGICLSIKIKNRISYAFPHYINFLNLLCKSVNKKVHVKLDNESFELFKLIKYCTEFDKRERNFNFSDSLSQNLCEILTKEDVFSLVTDITAEAPVEMNDKLSDIFISKIGEMFNNALEHSEGVIAGAKYFLQQDLYRFSCYDTGIGIPKKVIGIISADFTQEEAFKWAMGRGNSTANIIHDKSIPRGLGLDLLHNFVKANDGNIRICSGTIFYSYCRKHGVVYRNLSTPFKGTLYEIDIISDNSHTYIID